MKSLLITVAILVCMGVLLFTLTYPSFHREMRAARERLLADSEILKTDQGVIEYTRGFLRDIERSDE
jgi:hypothetical protein